MREMIFYTKNSRWSRAKIDLPVYFFYRDCYYVGYLASEFVCMCLYVCVCAHTHVHVHTCGGAGMVVWSITIGVRKIFKNGGINEVIFKAL